MKNKTLSWLSAFIWLIPSVFAAETFLDTLYEIFGSIALTELGAAGKGLFLAKFLLFIIVFTLIYYALKISIFQEKEQRNFAIWIAVAIGVSVVLIIPQGFIVQIFQTYAVIAIVALIGGPLLGMFMLTRIIKEKFEDHPRIAHILDAVLFYLLVVALKGVNENLVREYNILNYGQWTGFALAVAEVIMFYHIIAIFFSGGSKIEGTGAAEEAIGGAAKATKSPFTRAAGRMFKKGFRYEKEVVAELAEAKAALIAKPPEIIEIVNKLGAAGHKATDMLAIAEYVNDMQARADQVADAAHRANLKQNIDALANRIKSSVTIMQKEIGDYLKVLGPLALQVQQAGPAGTKGVVKLPPKFVADASRRFDNLIKLGKQVEDDILGLEVIGNRLERDYKV